MDQTEDKWRIIENQRLRDQTENLRKEFCLVVECSHDWTDYLIYILSLQIGLFFCK